MKARDYTGRYGCSVEATLDVIGGRWKGVILFHLLDGTKRFNELQRLVKGCTQRMLTLQLRELECDGVVNRTVYAQVPPKVEYSLTEFGHSLEPILLLMREWGDRYINLLTEQDINNTENTPKSDRDCPPLGSTIMRSQLDDNKPASRLG